MSYNDLWTNAEKRPYMAYAKDGVIDVVLGTIFMLAGAFLLWNDMIFLTLLVVLFAGPLIWALKRLITVPRLDDFEQIAWANPERSQRKIVAVLVLLALMLALAVAATFVLERWEIALSNQVWLWMAAGTFVLILVVLAYVFMAARMYVYAFLVIPTTFAISWFGEDLAWVFAGIGTLMALTGLALMIRFVTSHPRLAAR